MGGLSLPKIELTEQGENYGRFVAEPLERGFGVTLGNSLRRVLLAYLPGAAVTRVRIEGVQHEFTVIPNVKEDVMEFLLNVKELRLKALSDHGSTLVLEVEKEGPVFARDIKPSVDFEVVNPDLCLLTVTKPGTRLYIELDVEIGVGYRSAESSEDNPIGTIPVDAIFTPIRKVNFTVEPTHFGRETTQERLVLDIWTDGTIGPQEALSRAAEILLEQLKPFAEFVRLSQMKAEEKLIRLAIPDEKYNMPVEQLDLSVRTMNCLRRGNILTVGELLTKGPKELMKLRNFGQKSFQEIEEKLAALGLSFPNQEEEAADATKPKNTSKKQAASAVKEAEDAATEAEKTD
ncbi:MAG: DNA-directed RNA polymerase subunit alpha [Dehalococcoidales bacterium]|nr:DNA-directed RNA polymerase subunit alpha [Dehalococcoidales bacterium]